MTRRNKLIEKILSGISDNNIDFNDLTSLIEGFGFQCRIKGGHHIYFRDDVEEIINIQTLKDGKAKAYQVKQIRNLILKYKLNRNTDDE